MSFSLYFCIQSIVLPFFKEQHGATAIEYAIVATAISTIVLMAYTNGDMNEALSQSTQLLKENIKSAMDAF